MNKIKEKEYNIVTYRVVGELAIRQAQVCSGHPDQLRKNVLQCGQLDFAVVHYPLRLSVGRRRLRKLGLTCNIAGNILLWNEGIRFGHGCTRGGLP